MVCTFVFHPFGHWKRPGRGPVRSVGSALLAGSECFSLARDWLGGHCSLQLHFPVFKPSLCQSDGCSEYCYHDEQFVVRRTWAQV